MPGADTGTLINADEGFWIENRLHRLWFDISLAFSHRRLLGSGHFVPEGVRQAQIGDRV